MSEDRTWYPRDPDPAAGSGGDGREAGYRDRREGYGSGRPSRPGYGQDPYAQQPQYDRPSPPADPNNHYGRYDKYGQLLRGNQAAQGGQPPPPYRIDPPSNAAPPYDPYDPYGHAPVPQQPRRSAPRVGPGAEEDVWLPQTSSSAGRRGGYDAPPARGSAARSAGRGTAGMGAAGLSELAVNGTINPDLDLDELDPSGKARAGARNQAGPGKKKRSRGRTIAKWSSISLVTLLVFSLAGGVYIYKTTIGDFKSTPLTPKGLNQATLPTDPFGRQEMNILLIGSDTRDSNADCSLGGDCTGGSAAGANADAEIILHFSADRTNATVLSIPRDTEASIPNCSTDKSGNATLTGGSYQGQINSALQNGPECQVAADNALTGITITGYIMFDFGGVVSMSNALGGVPVCVTKAVHDKNSGLELPAGVSVVQGNTALEFLRTRDSFFDGSDLGREETTHYFFTQMIQTLRSKLNFSSLSTLVSIGQAAAKSTTVSNNLAGLTNLEGLVNGLNNIPNKAITFVTMPWELDPNNLSRVIPNQPDASTMFKNIQSDVSYTKSAAPPTAAAPTTPAIPVAPPSVNKATVSVNVYNADQVTGRAGAVASALSSDGFSRASSAGDATTTATTEVYYPAGDSAQADAVAAALKIPAAQVQQSSTYSKVTVLVGTDFESGASYPAAAAGSSTTTAPVAPADSGATTADTTGECIPVESGSLGLAHQ